MPFEGFIRVGQKPRSWGLDELSLDNLLIFKLIVFVKVLAGVLNYIQWQALALSVHDHDGPVVLCYRTMLAF